VTKTNLTHPAALLIIILVAGYLVYTGFFSKPKVDLAAYQALCNRYLQAPAGKYSKDQMQLLVYKINYLFPATADKLTQPAERQLKTCAKQLAAQLEPTK